MSVVHFVTNRCNARCSFCFIDFDDNNIYRDQLTIEEIDAFSRTLGPNLRNVNLTGGEPFLHPRLVDIARCYYRNTNIESIFITSNGSLPKRIRDFTSTIAREFPDRNLVYSFSIDSFPGRHDEIRKIGGLFEKTLESYRLIRDWGANIMGTVCITVSLENCESVRDIYDYLLEEHGVQGVTAVLVRDAGVYSTPMADKRKILDGYTRLTERIQSDLASGRLQGYSQGKLQGRVMNRKNEIMYEILRDTYVEPKFVSHCHAGALFGVIEADGTVHPCEVLDKPLGNLRDYDLDFMKLWHDSTAQQTREFIRDTKCNCSYECAWTFNILGNARYQPKLIAAALGR